MQRLRQREQEQMPLARCATWNAEADLVELSSRLGQGVQWLHLPATDPAEEVLSCPSSCTWLILDGRREPEVATRFLERGRALDYWGPTLVLLGANGLNCSVRLFRMDARLLIGEPTEDDLRLFLLRSARDGREHAWTQRATSLWRFTSRELEILRLSLSGVPRSLLPSMLALSENTVKTHVRSLLRKSRTSSIPELVGRLFWTSSP